MRYNRWQFENTYCIDKCGNVPPRIPPLTFPIHNCGISFQYRCSGGCSTRSETMSYPIASGAISHRALVRRRRCVIRFPPRDRTATIPGKQRVLSLNSQMRGGIHRRNGTKLISAAVERSSLYREIFYKPPKVICESEKSLHLINVWRWLKSMDCLHAC